MSGSTVDHVHEWVREGVHGYTPALGRKGAIHRCAREADVSERRIEAILHGEVRRVWADEYLAIRTAYRAWCRDRSIRLSVELAAIEAELNGITE